MSESIECSTLLPVEPAQLFDAWLDSAAHTAFTGSPASIEPFIGGRFTAWDGYITGETLALERPGRIVQAWRTSEFPDSAPASRLEVLIEPAREGARLTLVHSEIPDGQGDGYYTGWLDFYFAPMLAFYEGKLDGDDQTD